MKTPYIIGGVALVVVVAYVLYAKNKNKATATTDTQNASTRTQSAGTTTTTTTTTPNTPVAGVSPDLAAKLRGADYKFTHAGSVKYIDTAKSFWGVTSDEGLAVQKWLNRTAAANLVEDGIFGPASQRALQAKYGGAAIQPGVAQWPKDTIARIFFQDGSNLLPSTKGAELLAAINATPL